MAEKITANLTEENNTQKSCYVITPIGDDGSEIRKRTDSLINLCIKPVK